MSEEFIKWLNQEMNSYGIGVTELSRRAGVTHSAISQVLSGKNKPSAELCLGLANAFHIPPEQIFRIANLLPSVSLDNSSVQNITEMLQYMANDSYGRTYLLEIENLVRAFYKQTQSASQEEMRESKLQRLRELTLTMSESELRALLAQLIEQKRAR